MNVRVVKYSDVELKIFWPVGQQSVSAKQALRACMLVELLLSRINLTLQWQSSANHSMLHLRSSTSHMDTRTQE